jgi:hypothetical protein
MLGGAPAGDWRQEPETVGGPGEGVACGGWRVDGHTTHLLDRVLLQNFALTRECS